MVKVVESLGVTPENQETFVLICAIVSIIFGLYQVWKIMSIDVEDAVQIKVVDDEG